MSDPIPTDLVCRAPALPATLERAVLLMDKPKGWSSFDVIRRLRTTLGVRKIGHAGTLDPMATGLLICLVGRATKLMERFMEMPKVYTGTIRLGEQTPSYDAETEVTVAQPWAHLTDADLEAARAPFLGEIRQTTPAYSAVKIQGERSYKKARRGERYRMPTRDVRIDAFDLTGRDGQDVSFRVACSKGTYIRSLAHEYGETLGVGGHLVALRRMAIGPYHVDDAWTPEALAEALRKV